VSNIEQRRESAYRIMGTTALAVMTAPHITPQLKEIARLIRREGMPKVTRRIENVVINSETVHAPVYGPGADLVTSWPYYLKASPAPEARQVLGKWYLLPIYLRRVVSIESCCVAAGICPTVIVPVLIECIRQMAGQMSAILAYVNQPRVVEKTIEMALTDDGLQDRRDFHKATGWLPTPGGNKTQINMIQKNESATPPVAAPPPEQTVRTLVDRFNNTRALPPPTTEFLEITPSAPESVMVESDSGPDSESYEEGESE
jgi:hypothetical protein